MPAVDWRDEDSPQAVIARRLAVIGGRDRRGASLQRRYSHCSIAAWRLRRMASMSNASRGRFRRPLNASGPSGAGPEVSIAVPFSLLDPQVMPRRLRIAPRLIVRLPSLELVTAFLYGIRANKDRHREGASQVQIGSTLRF